MNPLKNYGRHMAAIIGAGLITTGLLLLVPRSPWSLVIVGCLILFVVLVSLVPENH